MRVLVTGGTGVVGRALVAALRARGDEVAVLARGPGADVRGDVTDAALVARAVDGVEVVFHLAGDALGGGAVNVDGTRTVVQAAGASRRGPRVIVGGTLAVYGPAEGALAEDTPFAPSSPYAVTNARADALARAHGAVVARLTNVYGPGDRHPSRLIPELVSAARDGRAPRLRSDGSPRRDLLHAGDAAAALIALADAGADPAIVAPGEAYNIGSGTGVAVREVVATLEALTGRPLHAVFTPGPEDGTTRVADTTRIATATGWAPRIALADGLRDLL